MKDSRRKDNLTYVPAFNPWITPTVLIWGSGRELSLVKFPAKKSLLKHSIDVGDKAYKHAISFLKVRV